MPSKTKRRIALIGLPILTQQDESIFDGLIKYGSTRKSWQYVLSAESNVDAFRFLRKANCDGAIVRILSKEMAKEAKKLPFPAINVSSWLEKPGIPTVSRDDAMIGRFAAEHLLQAGFRRFACVICPGGFYVRARAEGFQKAVETAGFPCVVHTIKAHYNDIEHPQRMTAADFLALQAWLAQLSAPVGLFWTEDHMGKELFHSCQNSGLRVPQDLAVVSAPNRISLCEASDPPMSSVNSPEAEIGFLAANWLDRLMDGEKMPAFHCKVPPTHVEARKSSDTLAVDDPMVAKAVSYIFKHVGDGLNASELIAKLNLPRRTFYRLFEDSTGQSPKDFIQRRRVQITLDLLSKNPELSLKEVAMQCGFRDRNRMNLTLLKTTGKSAQVLREEQTAKVPPR
jgi:LacI family transcriptional regulator